MKYYDPEIRFARFDSIIKTGAGIPELMSISENYNEATESLMERFETAAANAKDIFVYKWQ
ncbi:MAG: hypothetical protein IJH94_07295 [Clostridia bacterium]|nr:hypothetical protein [Clostridia bacterium]